MMRNPVLAAAMMVLMIISLMCVSREARAQSAVGGGPLTAALSDTEPQTGVLRIGPVRLAPGVTIREVGYDTNVFDETPEQGPKEDWVAAATPDVSVFARLRFVRISAYAGSELTYYHEYESERSVGYAFRGRFDFLLSRMRPFVGGGRLQTRTRPNGEIDTRADRTEDELSGGLAFDISPNSLVYASSSFSDTAYENAIEDGVDLSQSLNKERAEYQAGFKTDLTPLLSLQLYGSFTDDVFKYEPLRNSTSSAANATFRIAADAVVTGFITVGYKDQQPVDPLAKEFRGFTGSAAIIYPFLEVGRFHFTANRGTEYSFDASEAYYLENSFSLSYTHLLFGELDVQARGAKSFFDYSARVDSPPHTDTLDTAGGSVGYNLRNRTRIAVNYEFARRRSPEIASRNYDRRRYFLSWGFAF
jgi:hypothetical protein